jgi:hypothetical protein
VSGFHVGAAAAVEPVTFDHRLERRMRPHIVRPFRDDIDMRLQDQRAALLLARAMNADDDRRLRMFVRERRAAGMTSDGLAIHGETLHRVAALA